MPSSLFVLFVVLVHDLHDEFRVRFRARLPHRPVPVAHEFSLVHNLAVCVRLLDKEYQSRAAGRQVSRR